MWRSEIKFAIVEDGKVCTSRICQRNKSLSKTMILNVYYRRVHTSCVTPGWVRLASVRGGCGWTSGADDRNNHGMKKMQYIHSDWTLRDGVVLA